MQWHEVAGLPLKFGLLFVLLIGFGLSSYAQTTPEPGEKQHLYLKLHNDDPTIQDHIKVKPLSDDAAQPFSYSHYCYANNEEATLRLFEGNDIVAPDNGVAFHAQLTLMNNVPDLFIRFGVSIGDFKKTYSLNDYHPIDSLKIPRLYYNKGHLEVFQGTRIDIYYDGNLYQVHYEGIQIECQEVGPLSGLREAFVSTYGRLNTGGEVYFALAPYQGSLSDCRIPSFRCNRGGGINLDNCEVVYMDCEATGGDNCYIPLDPSTSCDFEATECTASERRAVEVQDFTAYPNPVANQLTIELTPIIDEHIRFDIIDAVGRIVLSQTENVWGNTMSTVSLDMSSLTSGIYYIKIGSAYKFETKKITVLR